MNRLIAEKLRERRSNETNAAIDSMRSLFESQEDALVGSFWYDPTSDELFGIYSVLASDTKYYESPQWNSEVRTGTKLHSTIWEKEFHRGRDMRFSGDYTKIPRGRVFEFKDVGFIVYTGHWIDDYPTVKDMIIDEFQLPADKTEFRKDSHWDLGHGWSDEF